METIWFNILAVTFGKNSWRVSLSKWGKEVFDKQKAVDDNK